MPRDTRDLLTDDESRQAFDQSLGLSRTVFPYVESHNFYVEHWYHTLFWNKVREFGHLLARNGLPWMTRRTSSTCSASEVSDALIDLRLAWAAGSTGRGLPFASDRGRAQDDHGRDARLVAAAGKPLPMVLEPHPGGRWYRELGGDNGHLWGFVQSIKRPVLLENLGAAVHVHGGDLEPALPAERDARGHAHHVHAHAGRAVPRGSPAAARIGMGRAACARPQGRRSAAI